MDKKRFSLIIIGCAAAVLASAFLGIAFGAVSLSPSEVIDGIFDSSSANGRIIYFVRLPRVMAALFSGAALAVAGAIIQSVLGNPLAAPNIIGVNAGAGFMTVLFMALFPTAYAFLPTASFVGAMLAVSAVYLISRLAGASKITLVLAGVAISSLFGAATDTVTTFFPDVLTGAASFKTGGFSAVTMQRLTPAMIVIIVGLTAAMLLSHELDVLALGESTAQSLGLNVKLICFAMLFIAAMLAGAAVSFSGLLGFIGLIIPNAVRKVISGESSRLLPVCALSGAAFTEACDIVSRTAFSPYEMPLGIIISYIGVPCFIWLLLKRKGGKHGA